MSTSPDVQLLSTMSDEEIKQYNKKLGKAVVLKVISGVAASVAVHFASAFLINKLESADKPEDTPAPNQ